MYTEKKRITICFAICFANSSCMPRPGFFKAGFRSSDKRRFPPTPAWRGAAGSHRSECKRARRPSVSEPQKAGLPIRFVRIVPYDKSFFDQIDFFPSFAFILIIFHNFLHFILQIAEDGV